MKTTVCAAAMVAGFGFFASGCDLTPGDARAMRDAMGASNGRQVHYNNTDYTQHSGPIRVHYGNSNTSAFLYLTNESSQKYCRVTVKYERGSSHYKMRPGQQINAGNSIYNWFQHIHTECQENSSQQIYLKNTQIRIFYGNRGFSSYMRVVNESSNLYCRVKFILKNGSAQYFNLRPGQQIYPGESTASGFRSVKDSCGHDSSAFNQDF